MKYLKHVIIIIFIVAFIYFFPRFIIRQLGPADPWTSYLYQYGFGLITFLVGIFIIINSKACQLGRGRDRFWFIILFVGFFIYALLHAIWIIAAQNFPYLGGS